MCYLSRKFEDEFLYVAIELGYSILSQKMDESSAVAIWQESNISRKAQRNIVHYLSDFFGERLIVPEYCITELGQNYVPTISNSLLDETFR